MSKNTGGQMFPSMKGNGLGQAGNTTFDPVGGVTLRDYFAAKAMEGLLVRWGVKGELSGADYDGMAKHAYGAADAMLVEREKTDEVKR